MFKSHPKMNMNSSGDMEKDIENMKGWSYYDNYQHGVYRDETMDGYGPCLFMNAAVIINPEGQIEKDKKWFADRDAPITLKNMNIYMSHMPDITDMILFRGDVSKKRHYFLRRFLGTYHRGILICSELGDIVDYIA